MAQISIPMSNKVGYSMYWSSMWDRKINFSRFLKEDIYLNTFIPLIFNDKISTKILKTFDFNELIKNNNFYNYNIHIKQENLKSNLFFNYIKELNKLNSFNSKVWIFKYQKWLIIFFFVYLTKFNSFKIVLKKENKKINKIYNNVNSLFNLYKISSLKTKYSYNYFNVCLNKNYF